MERVDLHGRSLLQVGEKFTLLPFRHVPVEEPYLSSYTFIPSPSAHDNEASVQVVSDGSHKNKRGALAVCFLGPYAPIEQAVIAQKRVEGECTSTKAELRAAIQALIMIRSALPFLGEMPIVYMTDSSFVLQVLEEQCNFNCHPHDIHQLLDLWMQVSHRVVKQHVKGRSGHPLNTLTDKCAKDALLFPHTRTVYRKADFTHVFLTLPHQCLPSFHDWL